MAKAEKKFKGVVAVETLTIGTKSPKKFKAGDEFATDNEGLFNSLLKLKKIKA